MDKSGILKRLSVYQPFDEEEQQHLRQLISFLADFDDFTNRENYNGHVTASAVLTDAGNENIVLLWHGKLNRWLQPGGHVESFDESLPGAAYRELIEEVDLDSAKVSLVSADILDIDIHQIPGNSKEPEHFHYDFRYHFVTKGNLTVSDSVKWLPVSEIVTFPATLSRFAKKISRL